MKTYQKPALLALSLSANDMLCSGCTVTTRDGNPWWLNDLLNDLNINWDSDGNGWLDDTEAAGIGIFGTGETGCDAHGVDNYCKYTVNDTFGTVFTS